MWTALYRPKLLKDVVGNQEIIKTIQNMMPQIPHLLLHGPPGVGKTTIAHCIVNELDCEYKELNASDESGINVVRVTIKNFVNTQSMNGKFKVIILDEADFTTTDFQTALRRLMEQYTLNCRFILTCNNVNNIIEPIRSRCKGGDFQLKPIKYSEFKQNILHILTKEQITITEEALIKLHEISHGDMRIIDKLYQISFQTKNITLSDILTIKDDDSWKQLLTLIKESKYTESCKIADKKHVIPIFQNLMSENLNDEKKIKVAKVVAEWEYRSHFVQTDFIQLYALIGSLISILKEEQKSKVNHTTNIFGISK